MVWTQLINQWHALSSIELAAFLLSSSAVWLMVRQNILSWPLGCVSVLLYAGLFYQVRLYSDMLLQLIYAPLQLYGWWRWFHPNSQNTAIATLTKAQRWSGLMLGLLTSFVLGYAMSTYTEAVLPWLDASLAAFSLVAQFWMAQKRIECWLLWIILDSIYVTLFWSRELYLTALLYLIFTGLAIAGWHSWKQTLRKNLCMY